MRYIHRLPFILSSSMAIIVGLISYRQSVTNQEIYTRMSISMIAFFIIGLVIKNLFEKIIEELENKKEQEAEELNNMDVEIPQEGNKETHKIDYKVDDYGEDFQPLKISEILSKKIEN